MAKKLIKRILQDDVYNLNKHPFSKGQKYYTEKGNLYEDIVLNEGSTELPQKEYRVAIVAPKMISENDSLPAENDSLRNSFVLHSDSGVYKIYYYDGDGNLQGIGEGLSTGWEPPSASTYDLLEYDGSSWSATKTLNRINEIKRTDQISFAEYDNDNPETGSFLSVHPLKYNNANGSLLIDTNKIWDDSDFSSQDITNWNAAHGWGDHSLVGYLTNETDPVFSAWDKSTGISITENQISDLQNYLTEATDQQLSLTDTETGTWISNISVNDHAITLSRTNTTTDTITVGSLISNGDISGVNGSFSGDIDVVNINASGAFNGTLGNVTIGEIVISSNLTISESGIFGTDSLGNETFSLFANTGALSIGDFTADNLVMSGDINAVNSTLSGNLNAVDGIFSGDIEAINNTLSGNLTAVDGHFSGDLVVDGTYYTVQAEDVFTENDHITLRDGAVSGLGTDQFAGIIAKIADGTNDAALVFNGSGNARVGDISYDGTIIYDDTQSIATREDSPTSTALIFWNDTLNRFDSTGLTWDGTNLSLNNQATSSLHTVRADRNIGAGSGLIDGGNLTSDITINLGTPSTIDGSTTNSTTTTSHTHTLGTLHHGDTDFADQKLNIASDVEFNSITVTSGVNLGGDLVPDTDNTGNVGTAAATWASGRFTDFFVDDSVGIGTNTPSSALDIISSTYPQLKINDGISGLSIQLKSFGSSEGRLTMGSSGEISASDGTFNIDAGGRDLTFRTAIGSTERMRIDSGGNVGIGTTTPDKKLHVNGDGIIGGLIIENNTAENYIDIRVA